MFFCKDTISLKLNIAKKSNNRGALDKDQKHNPKNYYLCKIKNLNE